MVFCIKQQRTLIFFKKFEHIATDEQNKAFAIVQKYHFQADLIWPDSPFK